MREVTSWRNPNYWTVTRIFCALLIGLLLRDVRPFDSITYGLALLIFVIAALTDIADGHLARTYDMKTKLGAFLDTLADKLLYLLPFWFFREQIGVKIFWAALVIESLLMLQRIVKLACGNKAIEANNWGKFKAWCQCSAIVSILLANFLMTFVPMPWMKKAAFASQATSAPAGALLFAIIQLLAALSIFSALAGLIFSTMSLAGQIFGFGKPRCPRCGGKDLKEEVAYDLEDAPVLCRQCRDCFHYFRAK